jgi:hypothetical protein
MEYSQNLIQLKKNLLIFEITGFYMCYGVNKYLMKLTAVLRLSKVALRV